MATIEKINCRLCKYFYVTWDKNFPNGCRAFEFKSRDMPYAVVYKNSGANCRAYSNRTK